MECAQTTWLTNKEYLQQFNQKVAQLRVPLSGSIELTPRCNLRCVHCYLGAQEIHHKQRRLEMSTEQVISIIDQVTEAGCLYLLITGGDPLLRKDFGQIYRHAKMNGLLITVFTNGTLITDKILELFSDLPPRAVEISLYGATAATYEKITGIKGSFERCLQGIQRLLAHKINLKLKTILMTYNRDEFFAIKNMAQEFGVDFRFDAAIFSCFNGDRTPIALRVSPKEAIEKEFVDADRRRQWQDFFERFRTAPVSDTLYQCGAGLASFHIDPYGHLQPCLMVNNLKYDLLQGGFSAGWHEVMPGIRDRKTDPTCACNQCEKRSLCGFCPPFFELENGTENTHSKYLCAIGHYRFQAIKNDILLGD